MIGAGEAAAHGSGRRPGRRLRAARRGAAVAAVVTAMVAAAGLLAAGVSEPARAAVTIGSGVLPMTGIDLTAQLTVAGLLVAAGGVLLLAAIAVARRRSE
ncbi:hypothetical protein GCM10023322_74960 [Rugosimonospora acidiphila]|uniref:LPXTG cell wall anchor domain-containing protein n=1 Tax=Rugosimonospora acidiphila TaxID=556531 RepID=A0ABP9SRH9_9ACTN